MKNKSGWIKLHDKKAHYFEDPKEASYCGDQWIDETFTLLNLSTDTMRLKDSTCAECLSRKIREELRKEHQD